MQASWEAEECAAAGPLRAAYQRQALDNFRSAASELEPQSKDWWTVQLAAAELERQLGDFEAAQARLDALPQDGLTQQGFYRRMGGARLLYKSAGLQGRVDRRYGSSVS